jgi:hypothetical protein
MEFDLKKRRAEHVRSLPEGYPCKTCLVCMTCDGTFARSEDGGITCRHRVTKTTVEERLESAKVPIPEDLKPALESAGTRGVIVDLNGLWQDSYSHENITGYVRLDNILDEMMDSEECVERCTKGFHYAFDSKDTSPRTYMICDDKKCVAQKKAAFTRARNAKNNAKKNAERAAFKEAVEATTELDKPRMKLVLYAQVHGNHVRENYSWQNNEQVNFLVKNLKIDVSGSDSEKAWKKIETAIDKLTAADLAQLVVGFMLNFLTYKGSSYGYYGSDRSHQDYKIKTTEVLNWLGVGINIKKPEKGGDK